MNFSDLKHVSIPRTHQQGDFTEFEIEATLNNQPPLKLSKRYSQFADLSKELGNAANSGTPFPRKHFRSVQGEKLDVRRQGLEAWLNTMLKTSADPQAENGRSESLPQPLASFLGLNGTSTTADVTPGSSVEESHSEKQAEEVGKQIRSGWGISHSTVLPGNHDDEVYSSVVRLEEFNSISNACEACNQDPEKYSADCYIVWSSNKEKHYMIFREGMLDQMCAQFNFSKGSD